MHLMNGLVAAVLLAAPSVGVGQTLRPVSGAVEVWPDAIARVARVDGRIVVVGDWIACGGPGTRSGATFNLPAFDALGRTNRPFATPTLGTHGAFGPMSCVGPGGSDVDDGTRWSLGAGYYNPVTLEDMTDVCAAPGSVISEIDLAWLWNPWVPSPCGIVIFPFEEPLMRDPVTGQCTDLQVFTDTGGGGIQMTWNNLPPGGDVPYVLFLSGLEGIGLRLPWSDDNGNSLPDGSYEVIFFVSTEPCDPLPCPVAPAQLLLWGTGDATGEVGRCGSNNAGAYTDDSPPDGFLTANECRDMAMGRCPEPLAHCVAFGVRACAADLNHDGFVDGIDMDILSAAFEMGTRDADLNGDGFVDGIDYDLFNIAFETLC